MYTSQTQKKLPESPKTAAGGLFRDTSSLSCTAKVSEVQQEKMFAKYDSDRSGYIDYTEFKKIWVRLANVKKELTDRGVKIPKVATNNMLSNMLEQIIDAEEDR